MNPRLASSESLPSSGGSADAVYDRRDGYAGPSISGFHARMQTGDPFRDPSFLKLR